MPRKSTKSAATPKSQPESPSTSSFVNETPTQSMPSYTTIMHAAPKNWTPLLMVVLIVASFFLGSFYQKIQYLEKGAPSTGNTQGQQAAVQPTTGPAPVVNVGVGHFPAMGDPKAKVTIVEFADPRCPFCKQFFDNTEQQLISDYVKTGKASFYFRNFDFLGPASVVGGDALECANDQGKFWAMHDFLYKNQPDESDTSMYNTQTLTQDAVTLGMDGTKFSQCLDSKADDSKQAADMADGQKAGVNGTPTFYVNGQQLVGAQPYSAFQTLINQELAKK